MLEQNPATALSEGLQDPRFAATAAPPKPGDKVELKIEDLTLSYTMPTPSEGPTQALTVTLSWVDHAGNTQEETFDLSLKPGTDDFKFSDLTPKQFANAILLPAEGFAVAQSAFKTSQSPPRLAYGYRVDIPADGGDDNPPTIGLYSSQSDFNSGVPAALGLDIPDDSLDGFADARDFYKGSTLMLRLFALARSMQNRGVLNEDVISDANTFTVEAMTRAANARFGDDATAGGTLEKRWGPLWASVLTNSIESKAMSLRQSDRARFDEIMNELDEAAEDPRKLASLFNKVYAAELADTEGFEGLVDEMHGYVVEPFNNGDADALIAYYLSGELDGSKFSEVEEGSQEATTINDHGGMLMHDCAMSGMVIGLSPEAAAAFALWVHPHKH